MRHLSKHNKLKSNKTHEQHITGRATGCLATIQANIVCMQPNNVIMKSNSEKQA